MNNTRFMNMSKLIDGTPLHPMGQIFNDIQDSAARLVGYGEGVWETRERWRKLVRRWGRAERRVGRGLKERRPMMMMMMTMMMGPEKFQKENLYQKGETSDVQKDSTLHVSPGPSHDLIRDDKITKARSKEGKSRVKKVGPGGYWSQSAKHHLLRQGIMLAPMSPVKKRLCLLRG